MYWGAWVAQSAEHPTLGFGLGHNLMVHEFEPRVGLRADSADPAGDSLSLSLSFSLSLCLPLLCLHACMHSFSLKINKP